MNEFEVMLAKYKPISEEINWYGWRNIYSGYGYVSMEQSAHLNIVTGDRVTVVDERLDKNDLGLWEAATPLMRYLHSKPVKPARIGIMKETPPFFPHIKNDFKIGYTMVETSKVGKIWVKFINGLDLCFVPSPHLVEVFKSSGVKVPVVPIRQGVDTSLYHYLDRPINRGVYTFGILSHMDHRKGWKSLVQAFCSEFSHDEPVRLLVKNTDPKFGYEFPSDERIKISHKILSFEEMVKFYYLLDCYVFPSRGEGNGQTTLEAMGTGLPCVLTNWSGLAQQCRSDMNFPLQPIGFTPDPRQLVGEQEGLQADIDVQELMYWMRWCYDHREQAKGMGKKASEWMRKEWDWWKCAEIMRGVLEEKVLR